MLKAIEFATIHHGKQTRRGSGLPYIIHPIRVARRLEEYICPSCEIDIEILQAAVLHDIIEDTKCSYEDIEKEFGKYVADLVRELTNENDVLNAMGKGAYLVKKMNAMFEDALLIKLFDRLDNISDYTIITEREKEYARQTVYILEGIKKRTWNYEKITNEIYKHCVNILGNELIEI